VLSSSAPLDRRHVVRSQSVMWPVMSRDICHAAFRGSSPNPHLRCPTRPPDPLSASRAARARPDCVSRSASPRSISLRPKSPPPASPAPLSGPPASPTLAAARASRLTRPAPHAPRASLTPRLTRATPTAFHATRAPRPPRPASPPLLLPLLTHRREQRVAARGDHAPARREQRVRREPCALARVPRVKHARALARVGVDRGRPRARAYAGRERGVPNGQPTLAAAQRVECRNMPCSSRFGVAVIASCLYMLWQYTTRVASFPLASTSSVPVSAPGRALPARFSCARRPATSLGPCTALAHRALRDLARSRSSRVPLLGTRPARTRSRCEIERVPAGAPGTATLSIYSNTHS
jgi:hypothetical protein